jgi:uncharacterized protein with GYD domain
MPKYLCVAKYSAEGVKGLMKEGGSGRRAAVEQAVKGLGGTLEAFYFAFGDDDAFVVVDVPDNASAAALSLAVGASGLASIRTTLLMTPEEVDQATKKTVGYRGPGR